VIQRKPYAIYAITRHGIAIGEKLRGQLPGSDLYVSQKLLTLAQPGALALPLPMGPTLTETFAAYDCQIFIISVGAVVRMIAPLLLNKKVDPAIICVDDAARFSICVLSGHVGRGNIFTERVANILDAQSIVTTASDAIGTLTVDILGREFGWTLDDPDRNVTRGCAAVVNAEPVLFIQETGEPDWWPREKPLPTGVHYATSLDSVNPDNFEVLLIATDREIRQHYPEQWANAVIYRPKSLILGLGCDRGLPLEVLERGISSILNHYQLSSKSIKAIATVTKKKDEVAFLELSNKYGWPMHTYEPEELDTVSGTENPSETVKRFVGTRGVSEPAALLASGATSLLVSKQKYSEPEQQQSMTLAIARIPFPSRVRETQI
jgi:cobalt-precorrin 5A hydrolase